MASHPICQYDFDHIYNRLQQTIRDNHVRCWTEPATGLSVYSARPTLQTDVPFQWDDIVASCRGLVIHTDSNTLVATPMVKFWSVDEHQAAAEYAMAPILSEDEEIEATEKIDGSLGVAFLWHGELYVTTRGGMASAQAQWAREHWRQTVPGIETLLKPGYTYCVEIVNKDNLVVVPYDWEGLALLAAFDANHKELTDTQLDHIAAEVGLRRPTKIHKTTLQQMRNEHTDDWEYSPGKTVSQEGWVLRNTKGLRYKWVNPAFQQTRHILRTVCPLSVWRALRLHPHIADALLAKVPHSHQLEMTSIREGLERQFDAIVKILTKLAATLNPVEKNKGTSKDRFQPILSAVDTSITHYKFVVLGRILAMLNSINKAKEKENRGSSLDTPPPLRGGSFTLHNTKKKNAHEGLEAFLCRLRYHFKHTYEAPDWWKETLMLDDYLPLNTPGFTRMAMAAMFTPLPANTPYGSEDNLIDCPWLSNTKVHAQLKSDCDLEHERQSSMKIKPSNTLLRRAQSSVSKSSEP
eukprot:TRINITY_DN60887_c0_g1_i1.p1 TRINITY_DN60887_c0_g1~~TRINITY_DN60887_c0_g1_i1.p1  ORF type:complete len:522 (+),score=37.41 TRINITY_DN60887_c0_g1_i1:67-1632(+)